MNRPDSAPLFVWASLARDEAPYRIETVACPTCRALVEADKLPAHRRWHRTRDGEIDA